MIDERTLGDVILRKLRSSHGPVEIDGLGSFCKNAAGGILFQPTQKPRVFLAYVVEDQPAVARLYDDLVRLGFDPWMDSQKLLPGQNWPRAIEQAIQISDFFVPCLSKRSVKKRGTFQAELRFALECARRVPLDQPYLVPVRLEECKVPSRITQEFQYVDLFPDWRRGLDRLATTLGSSVFS